MNRAHAGRNEAYSQATAKPLLVMFVGVPGSEKTYFAKRLADKLQAVTINSDAIRLSMWGSRDAIQATHATFRKRANANRFNVRCDGLCRYANYQGWL